MKCPKCHAENPDTKQFCADCGTRLFPPRGIEASVTKTLETTPDELARGTLFVGRYEIIEELGAGGMGRVYRAFDKKIEEEVALKLLKPEIAADKKTIDRFRNELKLARKIRHSNVCGMFDLGEEGKALFISMEYVRGEDLKSFLHRTKSLPLGTALSIARQVAEGLGEAHKLGITHRDLKPGNIMIDKEGNAKIMDFGIARSLMSAGTTAEGAVIGTPEYMSPEQVEGKAADARADIYALGVILFETLTGRVPFEGDTPLSVAHKHRYEPAPDARTLNPQIPAALSRLILHCLEKAREKRFQTAEDFLSDLTHIEEGLPTAERITPRRKPTVSRKITVEFTPKKLLIPVASVAVLIIAAVFLWRLFRPERAALVPSIKPSVAVLPFENYSGDSSLEYLRYAFPELLITDLSSSKYLKVLRQDEVNGVLKQLNLTEAKALSSDDIKKIALEAGVGNILKASFVKAGADFVVTAALISGQTGETLHTLSMKAQGVENIFTGIDGLTKEVKQGLNITPEQAASDIDLEIAKVTTRNPEALKYYVEGERLHLDAKYGESIESFKKAVELDPEFAMAHRMLGAAYSAGDYEKSMESYKKAFQLKDRMPPREYYILQGDLYRQSEATIHKAIEMYKKVLDFYPDDYLANHMLAISYEGVGELNLAIQQYSKIRKSRPRDLLFPFNIAIWYFWLGEKEKATQTVEEYVANNPGNEMGRILLSSCYMLQRRYDLCLQEMDKAIAINPERRLLYELCNGDVSYLRDEVEEASKFYKLLLQGKSEPDAINGVINLGCLDFLRGRPAEALERISSHGELFEKMPDQVWRHHWMGLVYLKLQKPEPALEEFKKAKDLAPEIKINLKRRELFWEALAQMEIGNLQEAEKLVAELDRLTPEFMRKVLGHTILYLRGRLALARKNFPEARRLFGEAVLVCLGEGLMGYGVLELEQDHALYLDSLASACLETGDLDNAIMNYEKIALLTYGRFCWGELYARSFYNLGKIYEQKGLKGKAAENYEKFISLWKDCEPRFRPLVEDARKRLTVFKNP